MARKHLGGKRWKSLGPHCSGSFSGFFTTAHPLKVSLATLLNKKWMWHPKRAFWINMRMEKSCSCYWSVYPLFIQFDSLMRRSQVNLQIHNYAKTAGKNSQERKRLFVGLCKQEDGIAITPRELGARGMRCQGLWDDGIGAYKSTKQFPT